MRSRYRIHDPLLPHFVTCTVVAWLPIFTTSACCDILVQSLLHCREHKGLKISAWVILDNHFHAIVSGPELPHILRDLKKFTARTLLEQIEKEGRDWLLHQLAFHRAKHKVDSQYQVWQEGSHPQEITSDAMLQQKLDYLHDNPVKRGHVSAPEHWRYSSAHEFLPGAQALFKCDPL